MQLTDDLTLAFTPAAEAEATWLPTERFCVRKVSAIHAAGRHWIYADVVPWDHPFWPDTYDTDIHAFSSADARTWEYHGPVITHREPGAWDFGGVGTPGAVAWRDRVYVFYSGRENPDGHVGRRAMGVAVADHPAGPFRKHPVPVIVPADPGAHLDDPCPVLSADGKAIDLYYRQADHPRPPPNYAIRRASSRDGGATWTDPVDVLRADTVIRAYESADAKRVGELIVLATFDHFVPDGFKTGFTTSRDGRHFTPSPDRYMEDTLCAGWDVPRCGLQLGLIPDADGICRHMGVARTVDAEDHYNLKIMPIEPLAAAP